MSVISLRNQPGKTTRAMYVMAADTNITTLGSWVKLASWRPMIDTLSMGASDDLTELIMPPGRGGYYAVSGCLSGNHSASNAGNGLQVKMTRNGVDLYGAVGSGLYAGTYQSATFAEKELYLNSGDALAVWVATIGTSFQFDILNSLRESFIAFRAVS